jgi:hypothetical protein
VGNLILRVGFALSIVGAAIGMTFAAPNGFGRSDAVAPAQTPTAAPAVAGYQAAPLTAENAGVAAPNSPSATERGQEAATLVALATTVVLLAIFVILFSYRPRPGGVRASHR